MKTLLLFLVALLAVSFCRASASDYGDWFKTFYRTDDVSQFDGFWKSTREDKILENERALAPTIGFVSQVLHRHPELIAGRLDDFTKYSAREKKAVEAILWHSDTEQARAILKANGQTKVADEPVPTIGEKLIEQAGDLDFCWGSFFASGDVSALDPIIGALDNAKYSGALARYKTSKKTEEDKAAALKDAIFGAAMWSLSANGKESPLVLAYLENTLSDKKTPDARRLWIAAVLSKLKPEKYKVDFDEGKKARITIKPDAAPQPPEQKLGWRDRDGNPVVSSDSRRSVDGFGASVVVTADPDWEKKWNTPPEVTPHFSETDRIRIGDRVAVLVFFAGPKADNCGDAEVTYDVTIRRPNGKVTTDKGMKGMKGKLLGSATNTYLAEAIIGFAGDPGDPLGDWLFEIAVHDVVRNVTVPLKAKVILEAASVTEGALATGKQKQ